jgi:ribonuclease HI
MPCVCTFTTEIDKCSNNVAEYEAALLGLRKLRAMRVHNCILKIDSKVIVGQIEKECMARDATLERYLANVRRMENYFKGFIAEYIERAKNIEADELAKTIARKAVLQPDVFFQTMKYPFIKTVEPEPRMVNIIEGEDWRAPIMTYLRHHYEPDNNMELLRMQQRAKAYQVIGDELYKTSVIGPLLRCLSRDEGKELLAQTHLGV